MEPGPLVMAVDNAETYRDGIRAIEQYVDNLTAARAYARAWRHGGMLFLLLCLAAAVMSVAGIWHDYPGENLIPWTSPALSGLSVYMTSRSSRLLRRAMAGYPARPR